MSKNRSHHRHENRTWTTDARQAESDLGSNQEKFQNIPPTRIKPERPNLLECALPEYHWLRRWLPKLSWPYIYGHNRIPVKSNESIISSKVYILWEWSFCWTVVLMTRLSWGVYIWRLCVLIFLSVPCTSPFYTPPLVVATMVCFQTTHQMSKYRV